MMSYQKFPILLPLLFLLLCLNLHSQDRAFRDQNDSNIYLTTQIAVPLFWLGSKSSIFSLGLLGEFSGLPLYAGIAAGFYGAGNQDSGVSGGCISFGIESNFRLPIEPYIGTNIILGYPFKEYREEDDAIVAGVDANIGIRFVLPNILLIKVLSGYLLMSASDGVNAGAGPYMSFVIGFHSLLVFDQ